MELKALNYFVEVVNEKSIHKAAAKLYMTQPSLTRAIQNLESTLGLQLLVRTNHGVQPTAAGENVYYYAKSIQELIHSLLKVEEIQTASLHTKLGIAVASVILNDSLMMQYIEKVHSDNMSIQIMESGVEDAFDNLENQVADFALIMVNNLQLPVLHKMASLKGFEVNTIQKTPLSICMSKDNPLMQQDEVKMSQLLDMAYIHLPNDYFSHINYSLLIDGFLLSDIKHTIVMNNYHSIICMLKHSDSFIVAGAWEQEELSKGNIGCKPLANSDMEAHLMWIKRKRDILPDNVNEFLKLLLDNYKPTPL